MATDVLPPSRSGSATSIGCAAVLIGGALANGTNAIAKAEVSWDEHDRAAVGMAELTVCEEVCAVEAEARSWQLRCYEIEAELRLLKQRRRGEVHPRWPADSDGVERLRRTASQLDSEAKRLEGDARQPIQKLNSAKMVNARIEDYIRQLMDDITHSEQDQAELEEQLKVSQEKWEGEALSLKAREDMIEADTKDARIAFGSFELLQQELMECREGISALNGRKEEMMMQIAVARIDCERLGMEIEDSLPCLRQLLESCGQASGNASRASDASKRKSEVYFEAEREAQESAEAVEERELLEQRELHNSRSELQEIGERTLEIADQIRRSRYSHGQQMQHVKQDGVALRLALVDSEMEHHQRAEDFMQLQEAVNVVLIGYESRLARERESHEEIEALDAEVQASTARLRALSEAAEEESSRYKAVISSLGVARESRIISEEEHREASSYKERMTSESAELAVELQRMRDDFGVVAIGRRSLEAMECREKVEELEEEGARLKWRCEAKSAEVISEHGRRERQLIARHAAWDAACKLKNSYADLAKQCRDGRSGGGREAAASAGKNLRRVGRHVDDLIRFLEASSKGVVDSDKAECAVDDVRLPESVIEAFVVTHEQTTMGALQSELLNAERQKALSLRMTTNESNETHSKQMARTQEQKDEFAAEMRACEEDLQEIKAAASEKKNILEEQLKVAGIRQTEVHMGAVADIQRQLQAHSQELSRLGRERAELHSRRCRRICRGASFNRGSSRSPSPGMPTRQTELSLQEQVDEKEQEVHQLRDRVKVAQERYAALLVEAGGQDSVQEAGLAVPFVQTSTGALAPRRSPSPVTAGSVQLPSPSLESRACGSSYPSGSTPGKNSSATNTLYSVRKGAVGPAIPSGSTVLSKLLKAKADPALAAQAYRISEQPSQYSSGKFAKQYSPGSVKRSAETGDDTAACVEIGTLGSGGNDVTPQGERSPASFHIDGGWKGGRMETSLDNIFGSDGLNENTVSSRPPVTHAESSMPSDMVIGIGRSHSPSAVRLQSEEPVGSQEFELQSPLSPGGSLTGVIVTADGVVECTPSPRRSPQSGFEIPGSAILVKQRRAELPNSGHTLEFDEARSNASGSSSNLLKFRRGESTRFSNGPSFDIGDTSHFYISEVYVSEADLADRAVSSTPTSLRTQVPSEGVTPMGCLSEGTGQADNDGIVKISSRPTSINFEDHAVSVEATDQVDLADNSLLSAGSQGANVHKGSHRSRGSTPSPRHFPATLRTTASLSSLHSTSSSRGAPGKPGTAQVISLPTSRPLSPAGSSPRAPLGGRMMWSAVVQSPASSPRNLSPRRTMSPGMPGPPRRSRSPSPGRSPSPVHVGPVKPWSAIAEEALSPGGSLSPRFDCSQIATVGTLTGTRSIDVPGALTGTRSADLFSLRSASQTPRQSLRGPDILGTLIGTLPRGTDLTGTMARGTDVLSLRSPPQSPCQSLRGHAESFALQSPSQSLVPSRGPSPSPSPPLSLTLQLPISASAPSLPKSPTIPIASAHMSRASVKPLGMAPPANSFPQLATTLSMPMIAPARHETFRPHVAAPPPTIKTIHRQWLPSALSLQAGPRRALPAATSPHIAALVKV